MTTPSDTTQQRATLRQQLRAARSQLDDTAAHAQSQSIAERLLPLLAQATHIAGYLAIGKEVDVASVLHHCQSLGKHTYVPVVVKDNQMVFAPYSMETPLIPNQYDILEPAVDPATVRHPTLLDVVIVPLVGFDRHCNRMGMGGGYYDRAFARQHDATTTDDNPVLIGVAYNLQRTDSVLPDWWDVPLDYVVTETEVITRHQ